MVGSTVKSMQVRVDKLYNSKPQVWIFKRNLNQLLTENPTDDPSHQKIHDGQHLTGEEKEPNPINRLLLEVTFSFIMAIDSSLALCFSGCDGGFLKRRRIEIGYS